MRRQFPVLLLALVMLLTVTACGGGAQTAEEAEATEEPSVEVETEKEDKQAGKTDELSGWAPASPITMVVASSPNQGADATARLLDQYAEKYLGQRVNFENLLGETGTQGWEELAARKPDGMTLGVVELPGFNVFLRDRKPDYTLRKYTAVCSYICGCDLLVVRANDSRLDSVDALVRYAQEHPGELTAATDGDRGNMHIGAQAFARSAVFAYTPVPAGSAAEALQLVRSAGADFCVVAMDDILGRENDLQILAAFSDVRTSAYPDVPTLGELGYYDQWLGGATCIVAPRGTPEDAIAFYENAFRSAVEDPGFQAAAAGTISAQFRGAAETGALIRGQQQVYESLDENFWTITLPEPVAEPPAEG